MVHYYDILLYTLKNREIDFHSVQTVCLREMWLETGGVINDTASYSTLIISIYASLGNINVNFNCFGNVLKPIMQKKSVNFCYRWEMTHLITCSLCRETCSSVMRPVSQHLSDVSSFTTKPATGTAWSPFSLRWFPSRLRCCRKVKGGKAGVDERNDRWVTDALRMRRRERWGRVEAC